MNLKSILVVSVMVVAALSSAQGGGGQGRRQGFGRNNNSMTGLLNRSDVQKELKITDDQKTKLAELQPQRGGGRGGNGGGGGNRGGGGQGGGNFDPEAMRKAQAEREAKVLAILDDSQKTRLQELYVQRAGNSALTNEKIQTALGFTAEQKTKVTDLQAKQREAMMTVGQKVQSGEIQQDEVRPLMEKNNKIMQEELGKILTPEQAEKFKAMGGTPFKFDADN